MITWDEIQDDIKAAFDKYSEYLKVLYAECAQAEIKLRAINTAIKDSELKQRKIIKKFEGALEKHGALVQDQFEKYQGLLSDSRVLSKRIEEIKNEIAMKEVHLADRERAAETTDRALAEREKEVQNRERRLLDRKRTLRRAVEEFKRKGLSLPKNITDPL